MGEAGRAILAIVSSVIGLSILAVVVSSQAQTSNVITSAGSALSQVIGAAVSPVTGGSGGALGGFANSLLGGLTGYG